MHPLGEKNSMPIRVRFFGSLRDLSEKGEIKVNLQNEGISILNLMQFLSEKLGEKFKNAMMNPETGCVRYYMKIMVNGIDLDVQDGLNTIVKEGDVIQVFPPIAGG
jgi:molybdopterin synthase sulfur carrier subunit